MLYVILFSLFDYHCCFSTTMVKIKINHFSTVRKKTILFIYIHTYELLMNFVLRILAI